MCHRSYETATFLSPAPLSLPSFFLPSTHFFSASICHSSIPHFNSTSLRNPPAPTCTASDSSQIPIPAEDPIAFEKLFLKGPVPGDTLVRTMSANGEVSCSVVSCTGLVSGAAKLHRTSPLASIAFGRALACALLMSSGKKDGETLQVEFRGTGPIKGITAIADGNAAVRGYVGNPSVKLPLNKGRLDVAAAIGDGILTVVRNSIFSKQPYTSLVRISSGQVAEDLAAYLLRSEQTPSALGAGIYVTSSGNVSAAGGYLLQLLPGCSSTSSEIVERNVRNAAAPTEMVRAGMTPEEMVSKLMRDLSPMKLASCSPRYFCQCGKDRVKRTVSLIPEEEVRQLLRDHGQIEATCEFCGQVYSLAPHEVEAIFAARNKS